MSSNNINPIHTPPATLPWTPADPALRTAQPFIRPLVPYALETAYHPIQAAFQPVPQGGNAGPSGVTGPYALPQGQTLGQVAGGTQAQPFDVTLSQLATAVYGTRGDPPAGWEAVSDAMLQARGIDNPAAWRQEFLGGGTVTSAQQFKAEIYTDGQGNFVLSYRGTAEGADDWGNNFRQGTGFETHDFSDKFTDTAVNTAVEFAERFGNDGGIDNLAITGHSQGGGLASVGALASGIPAVTFDASGVHPNTLERMGFSPEAARDIANNGGIRAYSLDSDLLSQAQESWVTGLLAPDALGTRIIVSPGAVAERTVFGRGAEVEFDNLTPTQRAALNVLVEGARHSGLPLIGTVGDLAYAAMSHNPNVLTAAMIEREPWQEGYQNPSNLGRDLQNLLPDAVKDDYARNTHDVITDVMEVVDTDFARGDYVRGGFRIAGDVTEGFFDSVGDTARGFGDQWAGDLREQTALWGDGLRGRGPWGMGDRLAVVVEGIGGAGAWTLENGSGAFDWAADGMGNGLETLFDLGGQGAQRGWNAAVDTVSTTVDAVATGWNTTVDAVSTGWNAAADTVSSGWDTVSSGASYVNSKMPWNW